MAGRTWEEPDEPPPPPRGPSPWTALSLAFLLLIGLVANGRPIGSPETRGGGARGRGARRGPAPRPSRPRPCCPLCCPRPCSPRRARRSRWTMPVARSPASWPLRSRSALAAGLLFLALGRRRPETGGRGGGRAVRAGHGRLGGQPVALAAPGRARVPVRCRLVRGAGGARALLARLERTGAGPGGRRRPSGGRARGHDARGARRALAAPRARCCCWGPLPGAALLYLREALQAGRRRCGARTAPAAVRSVPPGLAGFARQGLAGIHAARDRGGVGLVHAFRAGERGLAATLGVPVLAHWAWLGCLSGWHGGEPWGPRLLTDALPFPAAVPAGGFRCAGTSRRAAGRALGGRAGAGRFRRRLGAGPGYTVGPEAAARWQIASEPAACSWPGARGAARRADAARGPGGDRRASAS